MKKDSSIGVSPDNPIPLPNPKIFMEGLDMVNCYHEVLVNLMSDEVKQSIRDTYHLKASLCKLGSGQYGINQEKAKRSHYDDFLAKLSNAYGTDSLFKGGPKKFDGYLRSHLSAEKEYLFALIGEDLATADLLVLPRQEILKINGLYFEGRHTHREFLQKSPQGVLAAGTLYLDPHQVKFNFRTGHFMIHTEGCDILKKLRNAVLERVMFANDKTLPNNNPSKRKHLFYSLPYNKLDNPSHDVEAEFGKEMKTASRFFY